MFNINLKLEKFEGPIELLYHLIEKNEIDIYDIPIAQLTDQYISVIGGFPPDMESLSAFLVMAATLLEIKSKMLLPSKKDMEQADEIDPREELVRRLLEYKRFKDITDILKQREIDKPGNVFKEAEKSLMDIMEIPKVTVDEVLEGVSMERLMDVFLDVLNRKELKVDKIRSSYGYIKKDDFTIDDRMDHIRNIVRFRKSLSFHEIFTEDTEKSEVVATFLALLELIKLKEVRIRQDKVFDDIIINTV